MMWIVSSLVGTVLTATVTALCVSLGSNLTVVPRLAARSKRIQAAHDCRDSFSRTLLEILSLCACLKTFVAEDISDEARQRVEAEHERWIGALDEATRWLIDNLASVGGTYFGIGGVQDTAIKYAICCRAIWLSDRALEDRVCRIDELSTPAQTFFFASALRTRTAKFESMKTLQNLLADYSSTATSDTGVPAP